MAVEAGELDGRLVGLGAGIAEKRLVQAAQRGQAFRQLLLFGDAVNVGGMDQAACLIAQRVGHRRVGVSQPADGHAAEGVQVFLTRGIPQPGPFPPFEGDREPCIG